MSLVEYRNRLRLDRFAVLLDRGRTNLLEAALAAGFGSYAQFHRVFRALRHMTPREYLHKPRLTAPGRGGTPQMRTGRQWNAKTLVPRVQGCPIA